MNTTLFALVFLSGLVYGANILMKTDHASIVMGLNGDVQLFRSGVGQLQSNASLAIGGNVTLLANGQYVDIWQEFMNLRDTTIQQVSNLQGLVAQLNNSFARLNASFTAQQDRIAILEANATQLQGKLLALNSFVSGFFSPSSVFMSSSNVLTYVGVQANAPIRAAFTDFKVIGEQITCDERYLNCTIEGGGTYLFSASIQGYMAGTTSPSNSVLHFDFNINGSPSCAGGEVFQAGSSFGDASDFPVISCMRTLSNAATVVYFEFSVGNSPQFTKSTELWAYIIRVA